jgi:[CysO sulfur-carrier protein]-S-L-cysteine hydrolase
MEIDPSVLDAMAAHARDEAPNECCGLLVGTPSRIDESVRTKNLAASPARFLVDPREHIALTRRLRGSGRQVVGAYHSHVHSVAEPSPSDVAEAHYPEFVYVVVSLADPQHAAVGAYRVENGRVTPVALDVRPI